MHFTDPFGSPLLSISVSGADIDPFHKVHRISISFPLNFASISSLISVQESFQLFIRAAPPKEISKLPRSSGMSAK